MERLSVYEILTIEVYAYYSGKVENLRNCIDIVANLVHLKKIPPGRIYNSVLNAFTINYNGVVAIDKS